jgi:hypothetical protein
MLCLEELEIDVMPWLMDLIGEMHFLGKQSSCDVTMYLDVHLCNAIDEENNFDWE